MYDDVDPPWPDTKLAIYLCIGGPCKYKIRKETGINDDFISNYIMKDDVECYDKGPYIILGTALLFFYVYTRRENHCTIVSSSPDL